MYYSYVYTYTNKIESVRASQSKPHSLDHSQETLAEVGAAWSLNSVEDAGRLGTSSGFPSSSPEAQFQLLETQVLLLILAVALTRPIHIARVGSVTWL